MAADLHIYLPDELHREVKELGLPVSEIAQRAFRREIARREATALVGDADQLEIELWTPNDVSYTATFPGVWLLEPDRDETRSADEGFDAGAYWGVALLEGGGFLIYTAHCNDMWVPKHEIVADLEDAGLPSNVFAESALAFNALLAGGETSAKWTREAAYEIRVPLDLS